MGTLESGAPNELSKISEFFGAIAPMLHAYRFGVFSFAALLHNGEKTILRARLDLCAFKCGALKAPVSTGNLWAGQVALELNPRAVEDLARCAVLGARLPIIEEYLFKMEPRQPVAYLPGFSASYERMDQLPVEKLVISAASRHQLLGLRSMEIEGEVGELGFDSLESLMRVYGLHGSDDTTLEVSAGPVSFIRDTSQLKGQRARVGIGLAKGIEKDRLRIVCRNAEPDTHEMPLAIGGSDVTWEESDAECVAVCEFDLPFPQIVECRLLYAGRPQGRIRLEDSNCLPNPWRRILQLVAPDLSDLEKLLLHPLMKQAREFEIAVAWLFQILGFGCVHVGSILKKSEGPDNLAMSPDGTVLVIECTIDVPHDSKLMRLISRTLRMNELLRADRSGAAAISVLVTSLPAAELAGIRQKTEKHSILVLSRSDLEHAIERSKFAPNPGGMLQHWRHEIPMMKLMTEGLS